MSIRQIKENGRAFVLASWVYVKQAVSAFREFNKALSRIETIWPEDKEKISRKLEGK